MFINNKRTNDAKNKHDINVKVLILQQFIKKKLHLGNNVQSFFTSFSSFSVYFIDGNENCIHVFLGCVYNFTIISVLFVLLLDDKCSFLFLHSLNTWLLCFMFFHFYDFVFVFFIFSGNCFFEFYDDIQNDEKHLYFLYIFEELFLWSWLLKKWAVK